MENQILEAVLSLLSVIVTGVLSYVGKKAVGYINEHHKGNFALEAVRFVEETFKDFDGAEKFKKAAEVLVNKARAKGIKVTDNEVETLIQSACQQVKGDLSKIKVDEPVENDAVVEKVAAPVINPDQPLSTLKVSDLQHLLSNKSQ